MAVATVVIAMAEIIIAMEAATQIAIETGDPPPMIHAETGVIQSKQGHLVAIVLYAVR